MNKVNPHMRQPINAIDCVLGMTLDQSGFSTADLSLSPFYSNIGLTFGETDGIAGLMLHYNRRTICLGTPAVSTGVQAQGRAGNILSVNEKTTSVAFFAKDSFLIEGHKDLRVGFLDDPGTRIISRQAASGDTVIVHAMVQTLDPRDPDQEVPIWFTIRMLEGTFEGDWFKTSSKGRLIASVRVDLLVFDRIAALKTVADAPQAIAGAELLCKAWLETSLAGLSFNPASPAESEVLARAVISLVSNTVAAPGLIGGRLASYPSRGGYPTQFLWDACFHNLALEKMHPQLAHDALELIADTMREDGRMAHFVCSTWTRPLASQPPLFGWAAERLIEQTGDMELANSALETMRVNTEWWLGHRMTESGLIACFDPFETGWDDTPRLDHGPIIACDMNAYLLMQMRTAARLAAKLGRTDEAAELAATADAFAQTLVDVLFDKEDRVFRDALIADGTRLPVLSPASFLPLLGDVPLPMPVQRGMIERYLFDRERFFGEIPFPCVSYDDPAYDPRQMWRGPMWPPIYWLLLEVLEKLGFDEERKHCADRLYEIILNDGDLYEYFDSQTGEGLGFPQQGWTAAIFLRLHLDLYLKSRSADS